MSSGASKTMDKKEIVIPKAKLKEARRSLNLRDYGIPRNTAEYYEFLASKAQSQEIKDHHLETAKMIRKDMAERTRKLSERNDELALIETKAKSAQAQYNNYLLEVALERGPLVSQRFAHWRESHWQALSKRFVFLGKIFRALVSPNTLGAVTIVSLVLQMGFIAYFGVHYNLVFNSAAYLIAALLICLAAIQACENKSRLGLSICFGAGLAIFCSINFWSNLICNPDSIGIVYNPATARETVRLVYPGGIKSVRPPNLFKGDKLIWCEMTHQDYTADYGSYDGWSLSGQGNFGHRLDIKIAAKLSTNVDAFKTLDPATAAETNQRLKAQINDQAWRAVGNLVAATKGQQIMDGDIYRLLEEIDSLKNELYGYSEAKVSYVKLSQ